MYINRSENEYYRNRSISFSTVKFHRQERRTFRTPEMRPNERLRSGKNHIHDCPFNFIANYPSTLIRPPIRRETGLASLKVSYRDASVAAAGRSQGPFGGGCGDPSVAAAGCSSYYSVRRRVHFSRDFLFHLKGGRDLISEPIVNLV